MKAGFVNIFGRPNAGKSSLLNLLMSEKLAIVSPKVQTTRHRIKVILTEPDYQIVFSDTPGIIEPKYKLHERMMQAVKSSLVDVDVALLVVDINDNWKDVDEVFSSLALKTPTILLINKVDKSVTQRVEGAKAYFGSNKNYGKVLAVSAFRQADKQLILDAVVSLLPEGNAFFNSDELSDLPTKFFVSEMIREKIYELFDEEIPYQTTVLVQEFQEKTTLVKIRADVIVHRETQKAIILGEGGKMIKRLGTEARKEIEQFLQRKIFLELFIKVKPNWRENDLKLREFGY